MVQQRVTSFTTELSFEVIKIQGPHEGTAIIHVVHVLDLCIEQQEESTTKQEALMLSPPPRRPILNL